MKAFDSIAHISKEAMIKMYFGQIADQPFMVKHIPERDYMIWYADGIEPVLVGVELGNICTADGDDLMTVKEAMDRFESFRDWNECPDCYEGGIVWYECPDEYEARGCCHENRTIKY